MDKLCQWDRLDGVVIDAMGRHVSNADAIDCRGIDISVYLSKELRNVKLQPKYVASVLHNSFEARHYFR